MNRTFEAKGAIVKTLQEIRDTPGVVSRINGEGYEVLSLGTSDKNFFINAEYHKDVIGNVMVYTLKLGLENICVTQCSGRLVGTLWPIDFLVRGVTLVCTMKEDV